MGGAWFGWVVGLAYTVGLASIAKLPWALTLPLVLLLSTPWALWGSWATWWRTGSALQRPFAIASLAVVFEWCKGEVVNVWGTAPMFVRPLGSISWVNGWLPWTGLLGLVFFVVLTQALVIEALFATTPRSRLGFSFGAIATFVALLVPNIPRSLQHDTRTMRVAAVGWDDNSLQPHHVVDEQGFIRDVIAPAVATAARDRARIVVFPEAAFSIFERTRTRTFDALTSLARTSNVVLVVGFFDHAHNQNVSVFVGPDGQIAGDYHKTHLIWQTEEYTPGNGTVVLANIDGVNVGTMICQDDNFTDLARAYGRQGAQLVVTPSNDWVYIKDLHFSNSRVRPVENGFSMVRAVSHGVSAMVSSRGEALSVIDHTGQSVQVLVGDVPIPEKSGTLFSHAGNWPLIPSLVAVVALGIRRRNRPPRPDPVRG